MIFRQKVTEFTATQRGGENPDVQIIRTQYIPIPRTEAIKQIAQRTHKHKRSKVFDYGITEQQFEDILDKASKPINKKTPKSNE